MLSLFECETPTHVTFHVLPTVWVSAVVCARHQGSSQPLRSWRSQMCRHAGKDVTFLSTSKARANLPCCLWHLACVKQTGIRDINSHVRHPHPSCCKVANAPIKRIIATLRRSRLHHVPLAEPSFYPTHRRQACLSRHQRPRLPTREM